MLKGFLILPVFLLMPVTVKVSAHADKLPPKVSISSPAKGVKLQYLKSLYGWVKDNDGGSGISRVVVSIRRLSKGKVFYWDGYEWSRLSTKTASEFWYLAHLFGNRWRFDYVPRRSVSVDGHGTPQQQPPLVSGVYTFQVTAFDREGNKWSAKRSVKVNADVARPVIRFTHPKNRAVLTDFRSIRGVAQDKGGSGVATISCQITRSDGKQWDGYVWHTPYSGDVWMSEPMNFSKGQWQLSGRLLQGANLKSGLYSIEVAATDRAGNESSQVVRSRSRNNGYFFQAFPTTIMVQIR